MNSPAAPGFASLPLHIEDKGAGPPVVLLHSSGLSGRQWRKLASTLVERGFRAIAPDLTGHGASPPWPEPTPFSYHRDVSAVAALLAERGPAHLVGHSYGGFVGLLAALVAPTSVRSITMYEPVSFGVLDPVRDADARANLATVDDHWGSTEQDHERWLSMFVDYWGGQGAWAALRDEARAEFRRVGWAVYQGVRTLVGDTTDAAAYRVLDVPARFVTGTRSPIAAQRVAHTLGTALPRASTVTVDGAGHMGPLSHTDRVNAIVLSAIEAAEAGAQ